MGSVRDCVVRSPYQYFNSFDRDLSSTVFTDPDRETNRAGRFPFSRE